MILSAAADADSETLRDKIWRWYLSDVLPRLKPNGRVIVILTRWHEDDLVGRLLETQREQWTVVELPALAGEGDALGREPGEPLWCDDGYGYGQELLQKREQYARDGALRDWEALYQQQPRPPTGAIFDCSKITVVDLVTNVQRQCRAWDLAATASAGTRDADATVGLKLARLTDGRYAVLDVIRLRGGPAEVEAAIQAAAWGDGTAVPIVLPQDPGQAGKYQLQHLARGLAGFTIRPTRPSAQTGAKATRAMPVASQANVGNLLVARGNWNRAFIDELAGFPNGAHDDQVDALSDAFAIVSNTSKASEEIERMREHQRLLKEDPVYRWQHQRKNGLVGGQYLAALNG